MFDLGDELIIYTYGIPWLIWIQLLVMFLLVILLYYLTTSPSDLSLNFSTASPSPSANGLPFVNHSQLTSAAANTYHNSKVGENEIKETGPSTSEVMQRTKKEDARQRECSSAKDEGNRIMFEHSHHPCHIFGLCKQALLKCLGIDSTPENSSRSRCKKDN